MHLAQGFLGIDLGSTTVKYVLTDNKGTVLKRDYKRHQSAVVKTTYDCLLDIKNTFKDLKTLYITLTGSSALALACKLDLPFIQEVVASSSFLKHIEGGADVAIELGGEDGKILFVTNGTELRMNEACAGGTGSFIDQMALLLNTDAKGLDDLAKNSTKSYPIASRCGVFAKTDVVFLLNQGIPREDIAKSIFDAVCEQTISGLAMGREIVGKVCLLGGPLSFLTELSKSFKDKLSSDKTSFVDIKDGQYAIAHGVCYYVEQKLKNLEKTKSQNAQSSSTLNTKVKINPQGLDLVKREQKAVVLSNLDEVIAKLSVLDLSDNKDKLSALFESEDDYKEFKDFHDKQRAARKNLSDAKGPLYLGVDLGSTTVKCVLINDKNEICDSFYASNNGEPLKKLVPYVVTLVEKLPKEAFIEAICTTGYGADLAKAALNAQFSEVETLAHQRGACAFDKDTTYVIDIGGQDMKCIKVDNGIVKAITLNEACSSGCGSFIETFSHQLNLSVSDFVKAALKSKSPCDLGTRCTVFMNSKVKQAQRDNVAVEDIAAGLCLSIVRNALYKVLRIHNVSELGTHVVVQGGTFLNDAILRAFENHIGSKVIRPDIAGLMGAFGSALLAHERIDALKVELESLEQEYAKSQINAYAQVQAKTQAQALASQDTQENHDSDRTENKLVSNSQKDSQVDHACSTVGSTLGKDNVNTVVDVALSKLISQIRERQKLLTAPVLNAKTLDLSEIKTRQYRCKGCNNHCFVTMNTFSSGQKYIQGNRCDFALRNTKKGKDSGFVDYKNDLLFNREVVPEESARGTIGIPRVLNIYEHYPYWHSLFTNLNIHVELSPESSLSIYKLGISTIPSQSLCYPAKLTHGHMIYLASKGVKKLFLPCVPHELKTFAECDDSYACPVVGGYPEALRLNLESNVKDCTLYTPFLDIRKDATVIREIRKIFPFLNKREIKDAIVQAKISFYEYKKALQDKALELIEKAKEDNAPLIVLAGHPYHIDKLVNHGIPSLISSMGAYLVTEDAVCNLVNDKLKLDVVNQWAFHSRLYRAAYFCKEYNASLVQLVSFGCGIDAIVSEQIKRYLEHHGKIYTMLKIDEGDTLGAAKIRLKSLMCAREESKNLQRYGNNCISCSYVENKESNSLVECSSNAYLSSYSLDSHSTQSSKHTKERKDCQDIQDRQKSKSQDSQDKITISATKTRSEKNLQISGEVYVDESICDEVFTSEHGYINRKAQNDSLQSLPQDKSLDWESAVSQAFSIDNAIAFEELDRKSGIKKVKDNSILNGESLKGRKLYVPQMAPIHFPILIKALQSLGYNVKLLDNVTDKDIEVGLSYVNNDACYPAIVVIGQLVNSLLEGRIDKDKSALLLAQTCGPCRATNYTSLLNWALHDVNMSDVPVSTISATDIAVNTLPLEIGISGLYKLMISLCLGDLIQKLYYQTKTYEKYAGYSDRVRDEAIELASHSVKQKRISNYVKTVDKIVKLFLEVELVHRDIPKVGVVGEILLKYHHKANLDLMDTIIEEGAEPVLGDISSFILYCLNDSIYQVRHLKGSYMVAAISFLLSSRLNHLRRILIRALKNTCFDNFREFNDYKRMVDGIVSRGQQAGEGWLLTAEMIDFIESGVNNVLCVQPFACLPNHVTGKGVMRTVRQMYKDANLLALDFEAGTSKSNIANRLKLFICEAYDIKARGRSLKFKVI